MLFKAVSLYNYRSYSGTHTLELPTPTPDAPIQLIGGFNGFGKTSLQSAVRACLFADPDRPVVRASDLTKCPNWDAKPVVKVVLQFTQDGEDFRLTRIWTRRPGKAETASDSMELQSVLENTTQHESSTDEDEIAEFVRTVLPEQISDFFLFDGEAIQSYTDPRTSGERVKEALERLLGIHLYRRLKDDLSQVKNAIREDRGRVDVTDDLFQKTERRENIESRLRTIAHKRQQLRKAAGEINRKLSGMLRDQDKLAGWLDPATQAQRRELELTRQRLQDELDRVRAGIPNLLTEGLPIALFAAELANAYEQVRQREAQLDFPRTIKELAKFLWESRDTLFEGLERASDVGDVEAIVAKLLLGERAPSNMPQALRDAARILDLMRPAFNEVASASARTASLTHELQQVAAELASLPSPETVDVGLVELNRSIEEQQRVRARIEAELAGLSAEEEGLREEATALDRELQKLHTSSQRFDFYTRQIRLSDKLHDFLDAFIGDLTATRVEDLEALMTRKFLKLTNIPQAVDAVEVDRNDYCLSISFKEAAELEAELASAGQKEVLAFALISTLVEMSNKKLPVIIDTPLARLDSVHRRNLLTECFPHLGPQVLVLSTDEEIGREELAVLSRNIRSKHHLTYDVETKCSGFAEGYLVD